MAQIGRAALRWAKRLLLLVAIAAVMLLVGRIVQSERGPPLELWQTFVPDEPHAAEIDRLDWNGYLAAEARVFASVRKEVTDKLGEQNRRPDDRYFAESPVYPGHFARDWNRSYVLEPDGPPKGAVVLLHGLTRLALQLAAYRRPISRPGLHSDRATPPWPWDRARRADRHEMARLAGGDPACGPGGTATRRRRVHLCIWWVIRRAVRLP